jgi:sporulation protein YhbH
VIDKPRHDTTSGVIRWFDLFSRGARDWLRHNDKVADAVRERLPEIIANSDIMGGDGHRKVQVPVRFLEHYRFRLAPPDQQSGTGQGDVGEGDVLQHNMQPGAGGEKGDGGEDQGGVEFLVELKVDEIIDWLWEALELPNLKPKEGVTTEQDYQREGWNRRGARSRLDRRRSLKEAIKRRSIQKDAPPFVDDDLRYRQLVKRPRPSTQAVVFFVMDVSASMSQNDRQLAKTFFFWTIQGLKRQYQKLEPVFVAHTTEAWQFNEEEFFQVSGSGGTVASTAYGKVRELIESDYDPASYNIYLFYASDGQNFPQDREAATTRLAAIAEVASFMGYTEITSGQTRIDHTEIRRIFESIIEAGGHGSCYALTEPESIWAAIRAFFKEQAAEEA